MLEFGSPFIKNRLFFPPIQSTKAIVPATALRALFSAPYLFLPGVSGSVVTLILVTLVRQPGDAYTIGGAGNFQVDYENALQASVTINTPAVFGSTVLNVSNVIIPLQTLISPLSGFISSGLRLRMNGADLTGGSGDLHIHIQYRIWPFGTNLS